MARYWFNQLGTNSEYTFDKQADWILPNWMAFGNDESAFHCVFETLPDCNETKRCQVTIELIGNAHVTSHHDSSGDYQDLTALMEPPDIETQFLSLFWGRVKNASILITGTGAVNGEFASSSYPDPKNKEVVIVPRWIGSQCPPFPTPFTPWPKIRAEVIYTWHNKKTLHGLWSCRVWKDEKPARHPAMQVA